MANKKRGVRKTVVGKEEISLEKENSLEKELTGVNITSSSSNEKTPVFENTVYNIENKPELKETSIISVNHPEQEIKTSPIIETSEKKPMKKEIKVLIILVIILLIVDVLSLYLYYKPDLSGFTDFFKFKNAKVIEESNHSKECKDGTAYDSCSKNKPYYCYNGELLKKAASCGCPSGYKVAFQDCKKI